MYAISWSLCSIFTYIDRSFNCCVTLNTNEINTTLPSSIFIMFIRYKIRHKTKSKTFFESRYGKFSVYGFLILRTMSLKSDYSMSGRIS